RTVRPCLPELSRSPTGPSTCVTHRPVRPRRCCQRAWPRSIGGAHPRDERLERPAAAAREAAAVVQSARKPGHTSMVVVAAGKGGGGGPGSLGPPLKARSKGGWASRPPPR